MKQLEDYSKKRDLESSAEPRGIVRGSGYPLPIFVVQRHDARTLHFDLRLEHRGVLLSWAVTRKPVLNKSIKRLAVRVEDHPLDYGNFEGHIAKGNYGAGTVRIWDRGFYYLEEATSKEKIEKQMDDKLRKGHFVLYLKGQKLDGRFVLVKFGKGVNDWLLYYDDTDKAEPDNIDDKMFFGFIPPMLPSIGERPFDHPDWLFEPKLDGYRVISVLDKDDVRLYSRNGKEITTDYPTIVKQLKEYDVKAVLDGELISLDKQGRPSFSLLRHNSSSDIYYYIFDILYLKRTNLTALPLEKRKVILDDSIADRTSVKKIIYLREEGVRLYDKVLSLGFEGIIAKKVDSIYGSGRTLDWLKIKKDKSLDLTVIGYLPDERGMFKSLMVGEANSPTTFTYRGNVGSGFSESDKREIMPRLKIIPRPRNIAGLPPTLSDIFVHPGVIIEVGFLEVTDDGKLRHPVFKRVRDDK